VVEALLTGYPGFWVFIQHFADQVFGFGRYVPPVLVFKLEFLLQHVLEDLFVVVALEGRIAAQQDEQDDA
jgi:hypothetical protein